MAVSIRILAVVSLVRPLIAALVAAGCSTPAERPAPTAPHDVVEDVEPSDVADVPDDDIAPPPPDDGVVDFGPIGGEDLGPRVGDGSVGAACFLDEQCAGDGLCLDWEGGYCTFLNCPTVFQCPEGSGCVDLGGGKTICLELCGECREHYGCKPFVSVNAGVLSGCVGVSETAAPPGGLCEEHTDCAGALACLSFVPGGYCALIGCEPDTCPASTECVTYNGQPTCLAACGTTDDCLVGGAEDRTCAPLLDLSLKVAHVCIPSVDGIGVGSECTLDIECESNECRIVAEGKCVGSSLGCFTDADCPGAGVCELAPAYVKGVCTQACAADVKCPGNTLCIQTLAGPSWCQVPCPGLNDAITCDKTLGESCVFGDPLAGTGGGTYACVVLKSGDPGMLCAADEDCKGGGCLGVCAPPCGEDLSCPFPAACVEHDGALRCMKRCFSLQDCAPTMACKTTPTAFSKICVPQ